MKRRLKILFIIAAVPVVLAAAGGWVADRWLQSPEAHDRVEHEIASAVHMPVKLGKISFSAWSGLNVAGITVPAGDGNLFEAASFSASPKFTSLLRGRIGIAEVRLVRPRFRLVESADGRWRMPEAPVTAAMPSPPPAAAPAAPAVAPSAAVPPAPPAPAQTSPPPARVAAEPKKRPEISVGKIVIADGGAELIDKQKQPFATITGLNATLKNVSEKSADGELEIGSAVLPGYATIDHLTVAAEFQDTAFTVKKMRANVCGGTVVADFSRTEGAPTNTHLVLDKVNIGLLGKEARARIRNASGIVSSEARITGLEGDPKAMTGSGTVSLTSGRCTEIELVRQIGEVLRLAAIAGFEVREAKANFQIASGNVVLKPMEISSHPVGIALSGNVAFDGAVDLTGILRAPGNLVAKGGFMASQFSPPDANGMRGLKFDIKGTLDKPKQNLAEKLTGTTDRKAQRVIAVGSILSGLLDKNHRKPTTGEPKQPAPAPAAQP